MSERIDIVDLDEGDAERIASELRENGFEVRHFRSGLAALDAIRGAPPSLLLLEILLQDLSGTELLRRLRAHPATEQLPVIIVTKRADEIDRVIGFELGADDYIAKPFSARELVLRVRAVLRRARDGGTVSSPDRTVVGPLQVDIMRHEVRVLDQRVPLTALEFRLLVDLAKRHGRVQTREDLLQRVWRAPGELNARTVDTHVKRLREKLGVGGAWIETVRGVGYRLRKPG